MQIVIDLPEVTYKEIQRHGLFLNSMDKSNLEKALQKCMTLPKVEEGEQK